MTKYTPRYVFLLLILSLHSSLIAQISFELDNSILSGNQSPGPYTVGVVDINGDYQDDIIQVPSGNTLNLSLQCPGEPTFSNVEIEETYNGIPWTMAIADLDQDGLKEIMLAGAYDGVSIYGYSGNTMSGYEKTQNITTSLFAQGANFVDINGDQKLDLFACDDDAISDIWLNDGSGALQEEIGMINFNTTPSSDNSGNYGSEWLDIDDDGDLDLHIAKCRQFANSPTDPRRINALYINDGSNQYTEQAAAFGLANGRQSWVATFADLDNDGDADGFVVNHDEPFQILENNNNSFTAIETDISFNGIQGIIQDFDNDGLLDVLLTGPMDLLLHNQGNLTFTKIENPLGDKNVFSAACGDFNNDGYIDVLANYSAGLAAPSGIPDEVFLNTASANNYIKISLEGTSSDINAIGARVLLYGDWGIQRRDIKAGEGYGIVNSFNLNFGLGASTSIDSLVIHWPSGNKTVDTNLGINDHFLKIEDSCLNSFAPVTGDFFFCDGEETTISVDTNQPVIWSNGQQGSSITVSEEGNYFARIDLGGGCIQQSAVACVKNLQESLDFAISSDGAKNICFGEEITLSVGAGFGDTEWSTNETGPSIIVDEPGTYTASIELAGCVLTEEIIVEMLDPSILSTMNDTVYVDGASVNLYAEGDSIRWYDQAMGGNFLGVGNTYSTPINANTSFYAENYETLITPDLITGMVAPQELFYADDISGQLFFDSFREFVLKSVVINTDLTGPRTIELRNNQGTILQSAIVNINQTGFVTLDLNFNVPIGDNLLLTTNTNDNVQNLGFESPRFSIVNGLSVNYPYQIDQLVSLKNSNFGVQLYFYFFEWAIEESDLTCLSDRVEVLGVLETSSTTDLGAHGISISPNPTSDLVRIKSPELEIQKIELLTYTGKRILAKQEIEEINLTSYNPGIYILKLYTDDKTFVHKLIKI